MVDARTAVRHAQQVEMLATSVLVAAQQVIDASVACFEQVGAYGVLHPHLFHQSFCHIRDDDAMVDTRDLLHCQLQAGGRPSSPDIAGHTSPLDLDELMARFNDVSASDSHSKPFFQDRGDDDGYQE